MAVYKRRFTGVGGRGAEWPRVLQTRDFLLAILTNFFGNFNPYNSFSRRRRIHFSTVVELLHRLHLFTAH